jgi:FPC/CPF motif-containing protein YcgG
MTSSNPFCSDVALRLSNAIGWENGNTRTTLGRQPTPQLAEIHDAFRTKMFSDTMPCVGAKTATHHGTYRLGTYGEMGDSETVEALLFDLEEFFLFARGESSRCQEMFVSFVAVFPGTQIESERQFHDLLWKQLQLIHDRDSQCYPWDPRVSSDPQSKKFAFSIGGCAFFVVGMNPLSSRFSRQFRWPALVFNPGPQFERLREIDKHELFKKIIEKRDIALQGSSNPMLSDFGEGYDALAYSGMMLGPEEIDHCVFAAKNSHAIENMGDALIRSADRDQACMAISQHVLRPISQRDICT